MAESPNINYTELLQKLRNNDSNAFGILYDIFNAKLVAYAKKYVMSEDLARDISHEALLRLAKNPPERAKNNNIAPWLYRVTRNLAIDKLRSISHEISLYDNNVPEQPADSNPFQDLINANDAVVIREILTKLPADLKIIVEQRIDQNMSFKDIADANGIPIGTALWKMHRALQLLRELWDNYGKVE